LKLQTKKSILRKARVPISHYLSKFQDIVKVDETMSTIPNNPAAEVYELRDRLRVRQEENDNLRDLMRQNTEELMSLQKRLRDSREQESGLNSKLLPLEHELEQVKRERDHFQKVNLELETRLSQKHKELSQAQIAHNDSVITSSSQLRSIREELAESNLHVLDLQDQLSLQGERMDDVLRNLQIIEEKYTRKCSETDIEIDSRDEKLRQQRRAGDDKRREVARLEHELALVQESMERAIHRAEESEQNAMNAVNEAEAANAMATAAKQAHEQAQAQIHAQAQAQAAATAAEAELPPQITTLSNRNRQDDDLNMRPAELYEAYEKSQQVIAKERGARRQAEMYLAKILKELESKAPLLTEQKEETNQILKEKDILSDRLDAVLSENSLLKDYCKTLDSNLNNVNIVGDDVQQCVTNTLRATLQELSNMRECRARAEDQWHQASLQRDQYKKLLPSHILAQAAASDMNINMNNNGGNTIKEKENIENSNSNDNATANATATATIKRLQIQIDIIQNQLTQNQKEHDQAMSLKSNELLSVRAEFNEMKILHTREESIKRKIIEEKERIQRDINNLKSKNQTIEHYKLNLEQLLENEQQQVQRMKQNVISANSEIESLKSSLWNEKEQGRISREAELTAIKALARQREDALQEAELAKTLQNVEQGLASRSDSQREKLQLHNEVLSKDASNLRVQLEDAVLSHGQRMASLEADLAISRVTVDERTRDAREARLAQVRAEGATKAAQERILLLDTQVERLQQRMSAIQGAASVEEVMIREEAAHKAELQLMVGKATDAAALAAAAESSMNLYRDIASAAERQLAELREEHIQTTKRDGEALVAAQAATALATSAEAQAIERAEEQSISAMTHMKELQELQSRMNAITAENEATLGAAQAEAAASRSLGVQQEADISRLNERVTILETTLANKETQLQYAVSVQVAAEAEAKRAVTALALNEQTIAEVSTSAVTQQLQLQEEKNKAENALSELKSLHDDTQRSNDLLHSQMQTLAARLKRFEETRSGVSLSGNTADSGNDEVAALTAQQEELREVLWVLKRERDNLSTKLASAEAEVSRQQGTMTSLQKAADEARLASKRETDKHAPTRNEVEFERLLHQVQQLNSLREKAKAVDVENDRLLRTNDKLSRELQVVRDGAAPRERQVRTLQNEKNQLDAVVGQLMKEKQTWATRLNEIANRYADIDPSQYRELRTQAEAATKQVQDLEKTRNEEIIDRAQKLAAKDEELKAAKTTVQGVERQAELLRNKMRQLKTQKEEMSKRASEAETDLETTRSQLDAASLELTRLREAEAEANAMVEAEELEQNQIQVNEALNIEEDAVEMNVVDVQTSASTSVSDPEPEKEKEKEQPEKEKKQSRKRSAPTKSSRTDSISSDVGDASASATAMDTTDTSPSESSLSVSDAAKREEMRLKTLLQMKLKDQGKQKEKETHAVVAPFTDALTEDDVDKQPAKRSKPSKPEKTAGDIVVASTVAISSTTDASVPSAKSVVNPFANFSSSSSTTASGSGSSTMSLGFLNAKATSTSFAPSASSSSTEKPLFFGSGTQATSTPSFLFGNQSTKTPFGGMLGSSSSQGGLHKMNEAAENEDEEE
jgi:nucleoprotein TPR